jgi:sulfate-transporting ATPase
LLIVVLIVNPNGVAYVTSGQVRAVLSFLRRIRIKPEPESDRVEPLPVSVLPDDSSEENRRNHVKAKLLSVENLSVRFGGVLALNDVSLTVEPGQIVGLIGPNGAGKTTFIDTVTGFIRSATGSVVLDGVAINRYSPRLRAKLGLGRSFQSLELFEDLTVAENLLVASETPQWNHYVMDLIYPGRPHFSEGAQDAIKQLGLAEDLENLPGSLPYGRRRLVAIARAMATQPSVLLLDEPAAGLSEFERLELCQMLKALATERGVGILLVEHDVELVMRTCDQVVALDFGSVIASGIPSVVRADESVVKAYLGDELSTDVHSAFGEGNDARL